jgi:hypothetical protein
MKRAVYFAQRLLTDLQTSPYRDRIFAVLDATHQATLSSELGRMGVSPANIIIWPENGVEYYYPPSLLDDVFGSGAKISIVGDEVSRNGLTYKKGELVEMIVSKLDSDTVMEPVFEKLLIDRISEKLGLASGAS